MKKISILLVILAITLSSYSQIFLGSSYNYIQKNIHPLTIEKYDNFYTATYDNGSTEQVYYFNKENICYLYAIVIPADFVSFYTEEFDRRYTLIKPFYWKEEDTGMCVDIIKIEKLTLVRFYYEKVVSNSI
jgi:hypothetical protein